LNEDRPILSAAKM